jgi:CBS domain-containing protein
MAERKVGTLVVLNRDDEPIGILTDRDLVLRVLAQGKDPRQTHVDEVMTRSPKTVSEATPIEHALALMRAGGFRRLPITGSDGTLTGLVSLDDILSLLAEEFFHVGTLVEDEMPIGTGATRIRGRAAG